MLFDMVPRGAERIPGLLVSGLFLALSGLGVAAAAEGQSALGMLVDYKDWEIGCDDTRACVALGMNPEEGTMSAYLRIAREGDADAEPEVDIVVFPPDDTSDKLKQPFARLSLDAHKSGGLPAGPLTLDEDGDVYRYQLPADAIGDLIEAMRSATRITVDLYDGNRKLTSEVISLAGSSAALLQMDDVQRRIGTVTALARRGDAAADTIPAVPELKVVKSLPITEVEDPLPAPPKDMAAPSKDDCTEGVAPYVAFDLGGGMKLWGGCASSGAYNYDYVFQMFSGEEDQNVAFLLPGEPGDDATHLWNPYVDSETKQLNSFFKGRGLGDCGDATEWAFDGEIFAPTLHISMGACRGVMPEDWPVLYRATPAAP